MNEISLFEIGLGLTALGLILLLLAAITMLVAGFSYHVGWGIGMSCLPPLTLLFIWMHWKLARKPIFRLLAALLLMGIGVSTLVFAHTGGHTGWLHAHTTPYLERWLPEVETEISMETGAGETRQPTIEPQRRMLGRKLDDVIAAYGFPRMRMEVGDTIFIRYAEWEFEARKDGTIIGVERVGND